MLGRVELLKSHHQGNGSYYILFEGSESDCSYWSPLETGNGLAAALEKLGQTAINTFALHCPEHTYFVFTLNSVRSELSTRVKRLTNDSPHLVVVTLSNLYSTNGWDSIDINRMIDPHNRVLDEAGPRPGSPPLRNQVKRLRKMVGAKRIILVDDVCFKGQTSKTLLMLGLPIVNIIGGVVTHNARTTLSRRRIVAKDQYGKVCKIDYQQPLRLHPVITVALPEDTHGQFIDTCPLHDFIPFAPYCGLTIGVATTIGPLPLIREGVAFSRPYLVPYLSPRLFESKSSLPVAVAEDFSTAMLENTLHFLEKLEKQRGEAITPRVLAAINPNCAYPLAREEDIWEVDLDESVTTILARHLTLIGRN